MLEVGALYTHCSDKPKSCKWLVKDVDVVSMQVTIHPKSMPEYTRQVPIEFFEKWYVLFG